MLSNVAYIFVKPSLNWIDIYFCKLRVTVFNLCVKFDLWPIIIMLKLYFNTLYTTFDNRLIYCMMLTKVVYVYNNYQHIIILYCQSMVVCLILFSINIQ